MYGHSQLSRSGRLMCFLVERRNSFLPARYAQRLRESVTVSCRVWGRISALLSSTKDPSLHPRQLFVGLGVRLFIFCLCFEKPLWGRLANCPPSFCGGRLNSRGVTEGTPHL
ncbi:hypothetical protein CEXT_224351 [Caerostris extrusa]|uniref:Uncharacterized protein n=1 Tax=Caerostris extrusa TaxID=172846 RepID=A0AAV4XEY4_CAEEX|nr:hypothetical protein CEXT_224351 [Caerostris extrusa]